MQPDFLRVAQLKKASHLPLEDPANIEFSLFSPRSLFCLETCQRRLWIGVRENFPDAFSKALEARGADLFEGPDAYRFLLSFATGLESEVAGETEVFGQIKEAWLGFAIQNPGEAPSLLGTMQKLFEDAKEVRARFLQNLGSLSYGSLVRRILRKEGLQPDDEILVVGAGQLARAVLPWLTGNPVRVWNRSAARLEALTGSLKSNPNFRFMTGSANDPESERSAWDAARHVVLCVPVDESHELARVKWWADSIARGADKGVVLHLGAPLEACGAWAQSRVARFYGLEAVFEEQRGSRRARSIQLEQARRACDEKAKLRALGGMIPHGWEDLAAFGG